MVTDTIVFSGCPAVFRPGGGQREQTKPVESAYGARTPAAQRANSMLCWLSWSVAAKKAPSHARARGLLRQGIPEFVCPRHPPPGRAGTGKQPTIRQKAITLCGVILEKIFTLFSVIRQYAITLYNSVSRLLKMVTDTIVFSGCTVVFRRGGSRPKLLGCL
jgi:hypothetical protein